MLSYTLTIVYTDGSEKEVVLHKPHLLATNPAAAIVYEDTEGRTHNVPFTAVRDFYFHPQNYNICQDAIQKNTKCTCVNCEQKK